MQRSFSVLNSYRGEVRFWHLMRRPGMMALAGALCFLQCASSFAQTNYDRILSFGPLPGAGSSPRGRLIEASDGFLYGTTYGGGASGSGTIFRISKSAEAFSQIYAFTNGDFPCAGLVETSAGRLYGTTSNGGTNRSGTVFTIAGDGSGFAILHTFGSGAQDGAQPVGSLLRGADDRLYGTTFSGGLSNLGTIFCINSDGSGYYVLHSFGERGANDGSFPSAGLCWGFDGELYGTTQAGGSSGLGTVFRLNVDGSGYSLIHQFKGGQAEGRMPLGRLVQGEDGLLYGTTYYGGASDLGTIFKVSTNGSTFDLLWSFRGGGDGAQPYSGLLRSNNCFYGTTRFGGASGGGVVYTINADGSGHSILHTFATLTGDGEQPLGGLVFGSDGGLYGNAFWGGGYQTNGVNGILFRMSFNDQVVISSIAAVRSTSGTQKYSVGQSGWLISFLGGNAGQLYQIQASENPSSESWQTIGSSTAGIDGRFQFLDSQAPVLSRRFYRSACP